MSTAGFVQHLVARILECFSRHGTLTISRKRTRILTAMKDLLKDLGGGILRFLTTEQT